MLIPPLWAEKNRESISEPADVEYIEVEEIVPQDSWIDFYNYLIGRETEEYVAPPEQTNKLTPKNESFSRVMASLIPTSVANPPESSEDEKDSLHPSPNSKV